MGAKAEDISTKLQTFGHFLIYGETNSGKTVLTKHIIEIVNPKKIWIFVPRDMYDEDNLGTDDWKSHTLDGREVKVFCEWSKELVEEIKESSKQDKKETIPGTESSQRYNMIIFDDFNNEINTHTNTDYKDLFTRGRHNNLRIANLVHNTTAIGPIARKNCRFNLIMSATIDRNELKELSKVCYNGPENVFMNSLNQIRQKNKYSAMMIDKQDTRIASIAGNYAAIKEKDARVDACVAAAQNGDVDDVDNIVNNEVEVALPAGSSLLESPGNAAYDGIGDPFGGDNTNAQYINPAMGGNSFGSIGQKNILNNGQFADNSKNVYNTQYKVNQQQMLDTQMVNHNQRMLQMKLKMKEDLAMRKFKCWELVNQEGATLGEMSYVLETVNMMLRPKTPYNRTTLYRGIQRWTDVYFKQYKRPNIGEWAKFSEDGEGIGRMGNGMMLSGARIIDSENWSGSMSEAMGMLKYGLQIGRGKSGRNGNKKLLGY